jgi:addiction module HigA family antidote
MTKKKLPPVHPGEVLLEDFLKPLNLTMNRLALELRVSPNRISQIVEGDRDITADTAFRLARYFGTTPELWLGIQMQFNIETARDKLLAQIEREVQPRAAAKAA